MTTPTSCRFCGNALADVDGRLKCASCGAAASTTGVPAPSPPPAQEPKPPAAHHPIKERRKYLNAHREEIIADYRAMGQAATEKKWGLCKNALRAKLHKWDVKTNRASRIKPAAATPQSDLRLPPWSDNWDVQVQLRWLEVFDHLTLRGKEGK